MPLDGGARLHPGLDIAIRRFGFDDGDIVRALVSGELASPARFINSWYFRIRISGVGLSFRPAHKEHVYRKPALYLTHEFLDRAAGLPVVWEHPPKQVLDSEEFAKRIVGTVIKAYIGGSDGRQDTEDGDEVWAVARILDDEAAKQMRDDQLSTSPAVLLAPGESETQPVGKEQHLLVEGRAMLLDHVAICQSGVWDKQDGPTGVDRGNGALAGIERSDGVDAGNSGDAKGDEMAEENGKTEDKREEEKKEEAEAETKNDASRLDAMVSEKIDKVVAGIDMLSKRMDAYEADSKRRDDDRRRDDAAHRNDAARRDGEDEERAEREKSQAERLRQIASEEEKEGDKHEDKEEEKKDSRSDDDHRDDGRRMRDDDDRGRRARDDDDDRSRRARDDRRATRDDDDDRRHRARDDRRMRDDDDRGRRARDDADEGDEPSQRSREVAYADPYKGEAGDAPHDSRADARADSIRLLTRENSELRKRLDEIDRKIADKSPDEEVAYADAQARADSVYQAHGDRAPPPLRGERLIAYQMRLVRPMQRHSERWKDVDIGRTATADAKAFETIAAQIYADAAERARMPTTAAGSLRTVKRRDNAGREITEFYGDPLVWMNQFYPPAAAVKRLSAPPIGTVVVN